MFNEIADLQEQPSLNGKNYSCLKVQLLISVKQKHCNSAHIFLQVVLLLNNRSTKQLQCYIKINETGSAAIKSQKT